jgi:hypothetical protein
MANIKRDLLLSLLIVICCYDPALSQVSPTPATRLVSARTAYLIAAAANAQPGTTSSPISESLVSKPLAQKELTRAIQKWHRLEIVSDVSKADLVLLVVEWEDHHRWGNTIVCRDQLFVFEGGALPTDKSQPFWQGDPEKWGKWGGCSGAGEPVQELRKAIDNAGKVRR